MPVDFLEIVGGLMPSYNYPRDVRPNMLVGAHPETVVGKLVEVGVIDLVTRKLLWTDNTRKVESNGFAVGYCIPHDKLHEALNHKCEIYATCEGFAATPVTFMYYP